MEINDALGFGKLAVALLDKLEKVVGFIFQPIQIKRIANAEINAIKEAKDNLGDNIKIKVDNHNISIESSDNQSYIPQAIASVIKQELHKQENINAIVYETLKILEQKNLDEINVEINEDWLNIFIENAKNVSDDEMRFVWAKILSEEVVCNNSYSISTLNILRNMSKSDAALFTKVSKCSFGWADYEVLMNFEECKDIYELTLVDIMLLNDLGLINDSGKVLNCETNKSLTLSNKNNCYIFKNNSNVKKSIPINMFTRAGKEIKKLVEEEREFSDEELKLIFNTSQQCFLSIHKKINQHRYYTKAYKEIK